MRLIIRIFFFNFKLIVLFDYRTANVCMVDEFESPWSQGRDTRVVLAIFFISLLGVGMGQTAVCTLGIPYIDDNVASCESPLYFGEYFHQHSFLFISNLFYVFGNGKRKFNWNKIIQISNLQFCNLSLLLSLYQQ